MADKQSSSHYRFPSSVLLISLLSLSWAASFSKANLYHDHLDYSRNASRVNPIVQDSTRCRSDWASAAVAMLEGQQAGLELLDAEGRIRPLSYKMLIECLNIQCGQRLEDPLSPFDNVNLNGIALDSSYSPGLAGKCNRKHIRLMRRTFVPVPYEPHEFEELEGFEEFDNFLLDQLQTFGPIMVGVDRDALYGTGIDKCDNSGRINHYVTLVGYGISADGEKYFKYKNSWGADWGDKGYGRIERKKECRQFGVLLVLERVL